MYLRSKFMQIVRGGISSKPIFNFQVHGEGATNYSVVPWGGAAFNATQFSREELLINIADICSD